MTKLKSAVFPLLLAAMLLSGTSAFALIMTGGKGPMDNADWPRGVGELANLKSRFRWTEGPPFGGGEYRFEYRGGTAAFQKALEVLATVQAPKRELVICDGPGKMYAVNADEQRPVDWTFTVWSPTAYYRLYCRPDVGPISDEDPNYGEPLPPPRIHVYVWEKGGVHWKDVKVPAGIEVVDQRAQNAPVKPEGGGLVLGTVYDMSTGRPVPGAMVALEQFYGTPGPDAKAARTDENGQFRIEHTQKGSFYVHASADGYAARGAGRYTNEGLSFREETIHLAPARTLEGKVVDADGKPVAGVTVGVYARIGMDGRPYPVPRRDGRDSATSDADGRFQFPEQPEGYVDLAASGEWLMEQRHRLIQTADPLVPSRGNEIRLKVLRSGAIRGRVVMPAGGTLPPDTQVRLLRLDDLSIQSFIDSRPVGPDGTFSRPGMLPGDYLVDICDNDKRDAVMRADRPTLDALLNAVEHAPGTKRVSLKPGESVDVELTYTQ